MNKKILYILISIIIAVIFGGVGFFAGKNSGPSYEEIQKQVTTELKQKFASKVENNLLPFASFPDVEKKSLFGKIDSVQDGTFNLKVKNVYESGDFFDYLNGPDFYIKTVKIGDKTEIVRQEMKDSEKLNKEMEEYNKNSTGEWPVPYEEIPMTVKDLQQKDVDVSVETDTAITLEGSEVIDATKIVIENYNNNSNNENEELENIEE